MPLVSLPSAWSDYLTWLGFAVPGMLDRRNVDAMDYALRHLPGGTALVEIGSFCGLSTCALSYLKQRHRLPHAFFTCEPWQFEGQVLGSRLTEDTAVTHDDYRKLVRESFLRNVSTFCQPEPPRTIELDSDGFFESWRAGLKMADVFGRSVVLGGAIGFCYIDGNHSYACAKRDFENVDAFLAPGGFILFDDSADGSGWEVCRVIEEVAALGNYEVISHSPNYLLRKASGSATADRLVAEQAVKSKVG